MSRRHPRARPPSPYATVPRGLSWYEEVAEYRRGTPTIGVMPEEKNTVKNLIAGVDITHEPKGYDRCAYVSLHVVGTEGRRWFTPAEARAVAAALVKASGDAER